MLGRTFPGEKIFPISEKKFRSASTQHPCYEIQATIITTSLLLENLDNNGVTLKKWLTKPKK